MLLDAVPVPTYGYKEKAGIQKERIEGWKRSKEDGKGGRLWWSERKSMELRMDEAERGKTIRMKEKKEKTGME